MTKYYFKVTYLLIDSDEIREIYFPIISDDFLEAWQEVVDQAFYTGVAYEMDGKGSFELQGIQLESITNMNL